MKKILAILICTLLISVFPITVFAEGETETEFVTEELVETEPSDIVTEDLNDLSVDKIVEYVQVHLEEISVIVTLILSIFYNVRKHGKLNKTITTLNNNSIAVAENSAVSIKTSLDGMEGVVATVNAYKDAMLEALEEVRRNDAERASLEESLAEVSKYLKATRLANVELANEVAELLILANIPNSKKDEFYARHLAAVNAIAEAESIVLEPENTEVKENEDEGES